MIMEVLENECFRKACMFIEKGLAHHGTDVFELTDMLIKLELEKTHKESISDSRINFNDEIDSIEELGELETIDISVSGDNLFYCNNILTKNSFGLPATADFMVALISSEELQSLNQIMIKQLKNRFSDPEMYKRFVVGVDKSRMRLYDAESSAQDDIVDNGPVMDNSPASKFDKDKFRGFK